MQRDHLLSFALATATLLVAGCNQSDQNAAQRSSSDTTTKSSYNIGMSQCNLGEPWRVQMNADVKAAAAAHPEIEMLFSDASNKSETQQSQMREFIQRKVNLIIISPKEARPLVAPISEAMKAHIPVI